MRSGEWRLHCTWRDCCSLASASDRADGGTPAGSMAERLRVDGQRLQQFITDSPWKEEALWQAIRQEVVPHLGRLEAWVVDETGWVKQGQHSAGVARQYCGAVGKRANSQVSVEVTVSDGDITAPVAGQLYLPESWTRDQERCLGAGDTGRGEVCHEAGTGAGVDRTGAGRWRGSGAGVAMPCLSEIMPAFVNDAVYGDNAPSRVADWVWSFSCRSIRESIRDGPSRCRRSSRGRAAIPARELPPPGP